MQVLKMVLYLYYYNNIFYIYSNLTLKKHNINSNNYLSRRPGSMYMPTERALNHKFIYINPPS